MSGKHISFLLHVESSKEYGFMLPTIRILSKYLCFVNMSDMYFNHSLSSQTGGCNYYENKLAVRWTYTMRAAALEPFAGNPIWPLSVVCTYRADVSA